MGGGPPAHAFTAKMLIGSPSPRGSNTSAQMPRGDDFGRRSSLHLSHIQQLRSSQTRCIHVCFFYPQHTAYITVGNIMLLTNLEYDFTIWTNRSKRASPRRTSQRLLLQTPQPPARDAGTDTDVCCFPWRSSIDRRDVASRPSLSSTPCPSPSLG